MIVDEIHAVAGNKRGSHLALTLERLEHLAEPPVQRIGLSATQRPIETVARLLVGAGPDRSRPGRVAALRDRGLRAPPRPRPGPRAARRRARRGRVQRADGRDPGPDRRARAAAPDHAGVREHPPDGRAGRPPARRAARRRPGRGAPRQPVQGPAAAGRGPAARPATCGPWSRPRRWSWASTSGRSSWSARSARRAASPRSCSGSAGPTTPATGTPAGRLYPTSRDELVECAALLRGVRAGRLDALLVPDAPLDILAQQMVAECAAADWAEDDLLALVRRAAPFAGPVRRGLRRGRRAGLRGHPDRPRPPRRLPAPRPGERAAARPARGPDRRAHLRRGHPRARRLPGAGRAGRHPGRHRQRGLGHRVHGRRRVPARHALVADPPGRAGHRPGDRRAGRAALRPVLAGRGARPHPGAVRGGLRAPRAGRRSC